MVLQNRTKPEIIHSRIDFAPEAIEYQHWKVRKLPLVLANNPRTGAAGCKCRRQAAFYPSSSKPLPSSQSGRIKEPC